MAFLFSSVLAFGQIEDQFESAKLPEQEEHFYNVDRADQDYQGGEKGIQGGVLSILKKSGTRNRRMIILIIFRAPYLIMITIIFRVP